MNRHSRLRTPGQVRALALAGEDAGDALGDDRLEQRHALRRDGRHGDHLVARPEDPAQRLAPPDERLGQQRAAVEVEQVEGEERRRPARLAAPAVAPARRGSARPAPSTTTSSPSRIAERAATRTASPASSGSAADDVHARRASTIRDLAVAGRVGRADRHERPLAAPPRLEQVLVRVERLRQRARQHRPQVRQIGQQVGLEPQRELVGHRGRW